MQVFASSINPCDVDLVRSKEQATLAGDLHKVLGFDVSGVVVEVGKNVTRLQVGDEVWADAGEFGLRQDLVEMGAFAQYALLDEKQVLL